MTVEAMVYGVEGQGQQISSSRSIGIHEHSDNTENGHSTNGRKNESGMPIAISNTDEKNGVPKWSKSKSLRKSLNFGNTLRAARSHVQNASCFGRMYEPHDLDERFQLFLSNYSQPFSRKLHEEDLQKLWMVTFKWLQPPPEGKPDPRWKELGFQGDDPTTDLSRSQCGILPVRALLHFSQILPSTYQETFKRSQQDDERYYPFACGAMHVAHMLLEMLGAIRTVGSSSQGVCNVTRRRVGMMMAEDQEAILDVLCLSFMILDQQWHRNEATYMQFQQMIKATRKKLSQSMSKGNAHSAAHIAQMLQLPWKKTKK